MSLAWLDHDLTTWVYLWRLDRDDGVSLGFVSHDRDLIVAGFHYRAAPGMVPSTIALSDSLEVDSMEIEGVITHNAISDDDLSAGRWSGAHLQISLVDWFAPEEQVLPLLAGEFGEIVRSEAAFRVEILGVTSFLDEAIAPLTSPTCRARFGDRQCKTGLLAYQREVKVSAVKATALVFAELRGSAADYAFGTLRWLSGANCGLGSAIFTGKGNAVSLAEAVPQTVAIGDRVLLTAGCDKNFSTCRDRFRNHMNFRGEPYLPGNDLLTRYPGA